MLISALPYDGVVHEASVSVLKYSFHCYVVYFDCSLSVQLNQQTDYLFCYGEKVTWFLPIDWISVSKSVMGDDLKQKRTSKSAYLNEINRYIALFHLDLMALRQLLMSPSYRFNMFVYFTPCVRVCVYGCVHACAGVHVCACVRLFLSLSCAHPHTLWWNPSAKPLEINCYSVTLIVTLIANWYHSLIDNDILDASTHLYKRVCCPSVRLSIHWSVLNAFFQWADCGRKWTKMTRKTV